MGREYDWDSVEPSVALIETIAAFEQDDLTDPVSVLNPPLDACLDSDSLNTLVRSKTAVSITLRIAEYHVQIDENTVEVTKNIGSSDKRL
ncbi:HalOD1 output domain-containing protein [Halorubrum trueperi]|uniref:HalOD1 output domain-containing protein n=1 Tax=Halorubrum trueperi TaxID=2004704 RepID=A0ABD5UN77_9EURY